ncbi:MAG: chaperonin GroES [Parcubacteria group bacterium Gr01-1014_2]|nr:MAG: chaperonin GroES [Parcubacteria group bacterium Gr01-1014_2]
MKIRPLRDHVLIEPLKEEKKKGGIILPDTVEKDRPEKGRVLAVGPGKTDQNGKRIAMEVKKGDIVLFTKYGPNEIKVEDKKSGKEVEYLIAKEEDILAVIE